MYGINHDGLKAKRVFDEIVDYLQSGQEKISYPDRSATKKLMWRMCKVKIPKSNSTHKKSNEIEQQPHYYNNVKNMLNARQVKAQSIDRRNKILESQNRINYTNELERIRGVLSQMNLALRDDSIERLKKRQAMLESLGAQIIDRIN